MISNDRRRAAATLFLLLLWSAISGCNGVDGGDPLIEPWNGEVWVSYGFFEYDSLPTTATSNDRPTWAHQILVNARLVTRNGVYADVDEIAGSRSAEGLRAMDTATLRAKYAESLSSREELLLRLGNSGSASLPVHVLSLSIQHWTEERATALIEDTSKHTPLYGAVLLPIGTDPAVPSSPELSAFVAELLRIHEEWERY